MENLCIHTYLGLYNDTDTFPLLRNHLLFEKNFRGISCVGSLFPCDVYIIEIILFYPKEFMSRQLRIFLLILNIEK